MPQRRHIQINRAPTTERYIYPRFVKGPAFDRPKRDRAVHAGLLTQQLKQVRADIVARQPAAAANPEAYGAVLTFKSDPNFKLALDSLENRKQGIQLLNSHFDGTVMIATVHVPPRKMSHFFHLVKAYATKNFVKDGVDTGNPRHRDLIESISEIKLAALRSFWTDTPTPFPQRGQAIWWEVWLRVRSGRLDEADLQAFQNAAAPAGFRLGRYVSRFAERAVLLAYGRIEQWEEHPDLMDLLAELRLAKEIPTDYVDLPPRDQRDFITEAIGRIQEPPIGAPSICVLDTGVFSTHPLLAIALRPEDVQAVDPAWSTADHLGHGTQMAGLALYGCLTKIFNTTDEIILSHRLESVKILPPHGQNDPENYGQITQEAVARAEVAAPQRNRIVCMAVTSDSRDGGNPSLWSAAIDQLCAGELDEKRWPMLISAGNIRCISDASYEYPQSNHAESVQDPAQSWNALTVGAYTEKALIVSEGWMGWQPVASAGALCPTSTTSIPWFDDGWPIKPEIVMEGGNFGRDSGGRISDIDDLALLTTNFDATGRLLGLMRDTSAATALASRMAAQIQGAYPNWWPETIRGLMVHSAAWNNAMKQTFDIRTQAGKLRCLRCYGYGVPNLQQALWSANNSATLIFEGELQPFDKVDGKMKTKDMHLHSLPWPEDVLRELGDAPVTMRVTLSYFIEPNPGRRWANPMRYASFGLRFAVKRPLDSLDEFRRRISKAAWEEEDVRPVAHGENQPWYLGDRLQKLGSIHSDWWKGTAAELADSGVVAVYPVIGWWRERPQLERWKKYARYSLMATISTPDAEVNLYTPIAVQVGIPVDVDI